MIEKEIEVEADSLEEAKRQVKSQIPEGLRLFSEQVISDGLPKTIKAVAETTEAAFTKAQGNIPSNVNVVATDVTELTAPKQRVITVEAFDEQSARALIKGKLVPNEIIKNLKLSVPGTRGFFGFGKKPNQYEADLLQQAVVQITFKTKAKISAKIGEKPEEEESPLDALIIIFNRDISPKDTFVDSILTRMQARGRPYSSWMRKNTPMRIIVNPQARNPATFMATAMVQFHMLGIPFNPNRVEYAEFEGGYGVSGVILSHWKV